MGDSTPGPIDPNDSHLVSKTEYDRLVLFRNSVHARSRHFASEPGDVSDKDLLDAFDPVQTPHPSFDLLREAVIRLTGDREGSPTLGLIGSLGKIRDEFGATRDMYIDLRAAACQLLTYPPDSATSSVIDGLKALNREKALPLDDVDDANSLQRINSELEDEVNFINDRLVHAIRAVKHMTELALDVACERGGPGCSHD